jgi:uncharacterized membrane protein
MCIARRIPRAVTTPRLCSAYSLYTAAVVAQMNFSVMLYILYLPSLTFAILLVVGLIVKRDSVTDQIIISFVTYSLQSTVHWKKC